MTFFIYVGIAVSTPMFLYLISWSYISEPKLEQMS